MDPSTNLADQRQLAARLLRTYDAGRPIDGDDAAQLAELVLALDDWRRRGGFDPYALSATSVSAELGAPADPSAVALLLQLRGEWPLSTVGTEEEIDGGDVVEWLGTLAQQIDATLGAERVS